MRSRKLIGSAVLPLVIGLYCAAAAGRRSGPSIIDDGHFFDSATTQRAEQLIDQIRERYGKDVMVQTFQAVPSELRDQYQRQDRHEFFEQWLHTLARQHGVNGVFILMCREAGRLEVEPGNKTREQAFTDADRDELVKEMAEAFRAKKFNSGLLLGLALIDKRMGKNLGRGETASIPSTGPATQPDPATPPATQPTVDK